jgi:hypothetical protein
MIYRPAYFHVKILRECILKLRRLAKVQGLPGLHIVLGNTFRKNERKLSLQEYGADAFIEFPPHQFTMKETYEQNICNPDFKGKIFDLIELVKIYKNERNSNELTYKTVFPMWDNTSRKAETGAIIYINTTPKTYYDWLSYAIHTTKHIHKQEYNFVFLNAWNEWAEGAYLEPDRRYGYAFLEMTKKSIYNYRE